MSEKNALKNFQMSEQYWGCLDKMSEVNFSPAETLKTLGQFENLVFVIMSTRENIRLIARGSL